MRTIRGLFLAAGIYGVLIVAPLFFAEAQLSADYPPPITHPEYYYGFAVSVLGFQILYLMIAWDPVRFRPLMLLGAACKLGFAVAVAILYGAGRVAGLMAALAAIDAVLGLLYLAAWAKTPSRHAGDEHH
jgi:hypothetical protein